MNFEKYFSRDVALWLRENSEDASDITLIQEKPLFVTKNGKTINSPFFVSKFLLTDVVNKMCKGSLFASQNTLKHGYFTLDSGERIGACGKVVCDEGGKASYLREISALNIRLSRMVPGAADSIMNYIVSDGIIMNTLIIAPPSAGKTTILRDVARHLGKSYRVGIVDERSEIYTGEEMGEHTFVLDGASKSEGIVMMLRSMAPDVILTDEIGSDEDEKAIEKMLNCGVKIVCTAHGYEKNDLLRRSAFKSLIEGKVFERIIVLSLKKGYGTIEEVLDTRKELRYV